MADSSRNGFAALLLALLAAGLGVAEETAPTSLSLVVPNSLAGWTHSDNYPTGWTADGQRLRGCAAGSPLVSAWTLGDFTLEFDWTTIDAAALELLLPTSPAGSTVTILLNDAQAGQITDGEKQLAAGRKLAEGSTHQCRVERTGEKLIVTIDGQPVSEATVASDRRYGLSLAVPQAVAAIDNLRLSEPPGEAIFNGVDLTGWNTHRKADVWKVENGELVTMKKGGEYLRSEKEYENFTLTFDYLTDRGGNSGLAIRTPPEKWPSGQGIELQIYDRPGRENGSQMSIYRHLPPVARPDVSEAWNHVVVKCDGPIVTAWVNGQLAQHADLDAHPSLAKKPRRGWLGFQHHGSHTRVKNVYLVEHAPSAPPESNAESTTENP